MRIEQAVILWGLVILSGGCSSTVEVPIGHSAFKPVEQHSRGDILVRNLVDLRPPSPTREVIGIERNVYGGENKAYSNGDLSGDITACVADALRHLGYSPGDFSGDTINTNFNPTVMLNGHIDRFWTDLRLQTETEIEFKLSLLRMDGSKNALWKGGYSARNKGVNINGGLDAIAASITNAMDQALAKVVDGFASESFQNAVLSPRCPAYQGKTLSAWLSELEHWDGDTNANASIAFREMGTNVIPTLLQILQPRKTRNYWFRRTSDEGPWQKSAAWALYAMGSNASPAVLVLSNMLFQGRCLVSTSTALAGIGSEGIPLLFSALTNQNDQVQLSTARALGWARSDLKVVVPALIESLQNANPEVRGAAAGSLGRLRSHPELAVPALIKIFPGEPASNRKTILMALSHFGTDARDAVPLIVQALKDEDQTISRTAEIALKQIAPERSIDRGEQ